MIKQSPLWTTTQTWLTHPLGSVKKTFVMLQAYMDDSGTHDGSSHCLVAGYWGGASEWKRFERAWNKAVAEEGLEEFHAKEFWPRISGKRLGKYFGWNDDRHQSFADRLLAIIGSHKIYPFACGVIASEWEKQPVRLRKVYSGLHHLAAKNDSAIKSVFLPFQVCIVRAASYCHPGVPMNFIFDEDPKIAGRASQCFLKLKQEAIEDKDPILRNLGQLVFADSKKSAPLQAADLLAYEMYRYGKKRLHDRNAKMRIEGIRALIHFRSYEDFWLFDDVRFDGLNKMLEATARVKE